uniref:NADH-ubiquinone oxidoreductase chain 6 n=1 Tax=Discoglossus galganoi TaxID=97956 RepID=Q5MQM2_9ANUR|nr:NADH dehydrogenase subunit 6 [Discoglossus galganoi]AAS83392.1 NADH dehydrogenase subunit 6 [Discoglossus galganoi]
MIYLVSLLMVGLVLGLVAVASNPSPYYAALGLVAAAGAGCSVIAVSGASFLSLVLFLIYLGGMLVVFAYSAALTAEPYPEAWGNWSVVGYVLVYLVAVMLGYNFVGGVSFSGFFAEGGVGMERGDWVGVSGMYSNGGWLLFAGGWVLLLTLFVVLDLTRGHFRGALRAV